MRRPIQGPFYLAGALAYTQHWMSTDRIAFAGDRLQASFNAESFGGRAEAGYRIPGVLAAITPYAAVQAQNFHTPTYSETDVTGLGFGLTDNARNADDTRSELGARYDKLVLLNWGTVLAWRAKVAWAHDWITDPSIMPAFEALPGASFIVNGATPAKNSALTLCGCGIASHKRRVIPRQVRRRVRHAFADLRRHRHGALRLVTTPVIAPASGVFAAQQI
jgi:uncharacterized protein with beta-barrel porin domain